VSIRHHDVELSATRPDGQTNNWASGHVTRQVYLGSHRDYLVTLADGKQLRTISAAETSVATGQKIWLHFPPARCRALAK
jgi:iron(III) transport system ATP-binding protein